MIEYTYQNIRPYVNPQGGFISISFEMVATDGDIIERLSYHTPTPQATNEEGYTDEEQLEICHSIALTVGLAEELAKKIEFRKNRVPVVNDPTPPPPVLSESEQRDRWMNIVDDSIEATVSKYTRFQMGYTLREAAAQAYKDAGFVGDVDELVTRFADNVGMDYQAAAELILSQAATLRTALLDLENIRMDKYLIARAQTRELAESEFIRICNDINNIARTL